MKRQFPVSSSNTRPAGNMQRKRKKLKEQETKSLANSMLRYIKSSTSNTQEESATADGSRGVSEEQTPVEQNSDFMNPAESGEDGSAPSESDLKDGEEKKKQQQEDGSEWSDLEEEAENVPQCSETSDVGVWPFPVPDKLRVDIIKSGSEVFQNKNGPFCSGQRSGYSTKGQNRRLTTAWFYRDLANGERVLRKWMVYSPAKKQLFCFCCRLFATDVKAENQPKFVTGFDTWWKLNPKVSNHECSERHIACLDKWKNMRANLMIGKTIDNVQQKIEEKERRKWRDILYRLLDITLFLAKQNLAFRGHREHATADNRGNFLELVELLSKYDPVLKEHLLRLQQSRTAKKIVTTYLSHDTQDEFIKVLAKSVKDKILSEIKEAKYYGMILDSTPDVSHVDQMSEIIRYVHIEFESGQVEVKESFLGFFPLSGKKASDITEEILKNLEEDGLDIMMCRSQGYDNASVMAGVHSGVRARIQGLNPKALFVPCSNHSLNLCGVHAFADVPSCVNFFGKLESIYNFFSASTHRWDVLKKHIGVSVKRLCETRWSSQHDAVKPIYAHFTKVVSALENLCDSTENLETRGSAEVLLDSVCDFSFLTYLSLWSQVLEEVNDTQKYLQIEGISLDKSLMKMNNLKLFLKDNRTVSVDKALDFATAKCEELDIPVERRGRKKRKKMMPGENARDEGLTLQEELSRAMLECLDRFSEEINTRFKAMEDIAFHFAVIQSKNIIDATDTELKQLAKNLSERCDEVSQDDLLVEIPRLRRHIEAAKISKEVSKEWTSLQFLKFIVEFDILDSVPHVALVLRLFLTICVSVASCERSFSKLKIIKNYLRSTMAQSRLSNLAILSVEKELANELSFDKLIDTFASMRVRKEKMK